MTTPKLTLYNGLIEIAARLAVVLDVFYPNRLSYDDLRVLEHLTVYGEDVGMTASLQRRVEGRAAPYEFRKKIVLDALEFLVATKHVEGDVESGFRVGDESEANLLYGDYYDQVEAVCRHMKVSADSEGVVDYLARLRGDIESRLADPLGNMPDDPQFFLYSEQTRRDIVRMEGLSFAAFRFMLIRKRENPHPHPCFEGDWLERLDQAAQREVRLRARDLKELESLRMDSVA